MNNPFIRWERSDDRYSMTLCESLTPGETALLGSFSIRHKHSKWEGSEPSRQHGIALSDDDLRQLILTAVKLLGKGPAEESPAFRRTDVRCYPE